MYSLLGALIKAIHPGESVREKRDFGITVGLACECVWYLCLQRVLEAQGDGCVVGCCLPKGAVTVLLYSAFPT